MSLLIVLKYLLKILFALRGGFFLLLMPFFLYLLVIEEFSHIFGWTELFRKSLSNWFFAYLLILSMFVLRYLTFLSLILFYRELSHIFLLNKFMRIKNRRIFIIFIIKRSYDFLARPTQKLSGYKLWPIRRIFFSKFC